MFENSHRRKGAAVRSSLAALCALLFALACDSAKSSLKALPQGDYAWFHTNEGDLAFHLFRDKTPIAANNFIGLANGQRAYYDPNTKNVRFGYFYDGLLFFRIEPMLLIQGGDNFNTGYGTPGFNFGIEPDPAITFDKEGMLAMANAGPTINNSQFFITFKPMPELNGKYTIFGDLALGKDVLETLSKVPQNRFRHGSAPAFDIIMKTVRAYTVGPAGRVVLADMDKSVKLPEAKIPVIAPSQ